MLRDYSLKHLSRSAVPGRTPCEAPMFRLTTRLRFIEPQLPSLVDQPPEGARFTPEEAEIVVRMVHACGQVGVAEFVAFAPGFVAAARAALKQGAPILLAMPRWWRMASRARGFPPATS